MKQTSKETKKFNIDSLLVHFKLYKTNFFKAKKLDKKRIILKGFQFLK